MYSYEAERPKLFTEDMQRIFLQVRDKAAGLVAKSGAVLMGNIITGIGGTDTWKLMACVDRLVELGELREVSCQPGRGQDRIFIKPE